MNAQKMIKICLIAMGTFSDSFGYLTHQQQWQGVQKFSLPLELRPVGEAIAEFLQDSLVQEFFVYRPRLPLYAAQIGNTKGTYAEGFSPEQRRFAQVQDAVYAIDYDRKWQPKLDTICARYQAQVLNPSTRKASNTFYLTMPAFDGYVLKMRKYDWIDNNELVPSRYQLISRVFYRDEINRTIEKLQLDRIIKLQEYVIPIPGAWGIALDDDHYIVVAEPLPALPTEEENAQRWQSAQDAQGNWVDEDKKIAIEQLEQLAERVGLWSFGYHKAFLLQNTQGHWQILLTDIEKPGINGGLDKNFYHKDQAEKTRNWEGKSNGRDSLTKMFKSGLKSSAQ